MEKLIVKASRLCMVLHGAALLLIDPEVSVVIRHIPLASEALRQPAINHLSNLICHCHGLLVECDGLSAVLLWDVSCSTLKVTKKWARGAVPLGIQCTAEYRSPLAICSVVFRLFRG